METIGPIKPVASAYTVQVVGPLFDPVRIVLDFGSMHPQSRGMSPLTVADMALQLAAYREYAEARGTPKDQIDRDVFEVEEAARELRWKCAQDASPDAARRYVARMKPVDARVTRASLDRVFRWFEQCGICRAHLADMTAPQFATAINEFSTERIAEGKGEAYTVQIATHVRKLYESCGADTLDQLGTSDVQRYIESVRGTGNKKPTPKTLSHVRGQLVTYFKWAISKGYLTVSPAEGVKTPPDRRGDTRRPPTLEEFHKLIAVTRTQRHRNGAEAAWVYWCAGWTGLRRNEMRGIQWGDVELGEEPVITVRPEVSKVGKRDGRVERIPLVSRSLIDNLDRERRGKLRSDTVWPYLPTPGVFRTDLERAGIPPVDELGRVLVFHGLRSMLGTLLASKGVPDPVIAKILRHRDIRTTRRFYVKPEMDTMREALLRAEDDFHDFFGQARIEGLDEPIYMKYRSSGHQVGAAGMNHASLLPNGMATTGSTSSSPVTPISARKQTDNQKQGEATSHASGPLTAGTQTPEDAAPMTIEALGGLPVSTPNERDLAQVAALLSGIVARTLKERQ